MDDASILDLFRRRDERAVAEIQQKYGALCMHVACNLLPREDAEECVNSAYLALWNKIPPESPDDLKTYLCRIVRNLAVNRFQYLSAEKRSPKFTVSLDEIAECVPAAPDDAADGLAEIISRFLRTQNDLIRRVFVRRYWYGDSVAEIAEMFRINERTAATYLFRTRKKLKAFLQKEGYDYG